MAAERENTPPAQAGLNDSMSDGDGGSLIVLLLIVCAYFLPAIIAEARHHQNSTAITLLNLLLGWTVLGWIAALIWASTSNVRLRPPQSRPAPEKTQSNFRSDWIKRMSAPTTVPAAAPPVSPPNQPRINRFIPIGIAILVVFLLILLATVH